MRYPLLWFSFLRPMLPWKTGAPDGLDGLRSRGDSRFLSRKSPLLFEDAPDPATLLYKLFAAPEATPLLPELSNTLERAPGIQGSTRGKYMESDTGKKVLLGITCFLLMGYLLLLGCGGIQGSRSGGPTPTPTPTPGAFNGVLTWKGDSSR